jgi:hypothetical protein
MGSVVKKLLFESGVKPFVGEPIYKLSTLANP